MSLEKMKSLGYPVELWRFPDRNTAVGQMISSYLSNQSNLDDHTIHLLFSANPWEKKVVPIFLQFGLVSTLTFFVGYSISSV